MYAKIFSSLFDGSMRGKSDLILVFVNLLCHADQEGNVDRHWQAIVDETGLSMERVQEAIAELESPDKESRSPDDEGRRIVLIDDHRKWGWHIVNHKHYRDIASEQHRRELTRMRVEKHRSNACVTQQALQGVTPVDVVVDVDVAKKGSAEGEQPVSGEKISFLTKSFKKWTRDDLKASAEAENADGLLTQEHLDDFVAHWYDEKSPNGRPKLWTMDTWNTRLRMQTAYRMVYSKQNTDGKPRDWRGDMSKVKSPEEVCAEYERMGLYDKKENLK